MNVYNYIFCFFCRLYGRYIGNGRIIGAVHVAFAMLMHMLFLSEIVRRGFFRKVIKTGTDNFPVIRDIYWLVIVILVMVIYAIYTPLRAQRLLREYTIRYNDDVLGHILRVFFYLIVPTAGGILLAMMRKRAFM